MLRRPTSAVPGWPLTPTAGGRRGRWILVVALVCYVLVGFFPYLVSGLVVPPSAVAVLMAFWATGLLAIALAGRRRPWLAPAVVVLALVFWFAFVTLGSLLFGWTA